LFLKKTYEEAIKIFKKYSKLFDKAEWDNVLGKFLEKMMTDESRLRQIERNQLSSLLSSQYRNKSSSNFRFRDNPSDKMNYRNYDPESSNSIHLLPPTIPLQNIHHGLSKIQSNQSTLTTVPFTQPQFTNFEQKQYLYNPLELSESQLSESQYMPITTGGSKIQLRTFHFLEPKSYNEHAFRAEKPIIAGKMAYDFLRTHYKLKKESSIMFTIEDRMKDRKYNYIGEKINNKRIIKST
jgi:hypothetical protein